ncbi:MAG: methyltransferase, partial [Maioricimonas sp. JB049]
GIHGQETAAILDVYDFPDTQTLIDVGGGNGSKLAAILQKHPHLQGILYDLPHVVERARPHIEAAGLSDRCQLIGGDFFQHVPSGADTCLMRHIIHDWDDEKSTTILKNCHAALPEGGRLLVVETVILPGNAPCGAKFLDLTMMLIPGGKERTEEEYRTLYEAAGFELTRVIPTAGELNLVEGIRR